jgi:hypothetical protein
MPPPARSPACAVQVLGNLKFDMAPDPALLAPRPCLAPGLPRRWCWPPARAKARKRRCCSAWAALPRPRPLLLLVPRHPQRFDEVAALAQAACRGAAQRWGDDAAARARRRPTSGSATAWARCRCTTRWPTWRCWAAASRRWAGRT